MSKVYCYLAGKMSGLTLEEMNSWRLKAKWYLENLGINVFNPVDFYNFEIDSSTYTEQEVKDFDLMLVKKSNFILANLDYPNSIGTAIELHEAHDNWKIPVIGFGTKKNHPWIECSLTKKVDTLMDAIDYIKEFYVPVMCD